MAIGLGLVAICLAASGAGASVEVERVRWLSGLELRETTDATLLHVKLSRPARILGYAPPAPGRLVEIRLDPGAGPRSDGQMILDEESLRVTARPGSVVREVHLEPQSGGTGLLVVRFARPVAYAVSSDDGGATIVVRMPKGAAPALATPTTPRAGGALDPDALLDEAGRAMRAGEYAQAIALYTKVVELPEGPHSPVALEFLGLARQRNDQRAHARAEYELYLLRYPEGEGAERVRQRLEALRSSRQAERAPLERAESRDATTELDGYGTISTSYQRIESFADLSGAVLADSSQIAQIDVTGLARRGDWDARARGAGYYRYDYTGGDTGAGSRVQYLFMDVRHRRRRIRSAVGRQPGRSGGILGRFDGARVDWGLTSSTEVGAVFGFPQTGSIDNGLDTGRLFGGMRLAHFRWFDLFDSEAYVVAQSADGLVDRVGIGGSLRYVGRFGSVLVDVDYDAYYASLNLASLSGSVSLSRSTWLHLYADHRNVPFLTTRNATIGSADETLDVLEASLSLDEIEQLARDRTARATAVTLGIEQRVSTHWRLFADVTGSSMTGTPASGLVWSTPSTGWEFASLLQAVGNDLLLPGDTTRASLRIFAGRLYTDYLLVASARYPVGWNFQLTPLLAVDFRDQTDTRDVVSLRPGVQIQWHVGMFTFEADVRGEWMQAVGSGDPRPVSSQSGYLLFLTARMDF